MDTKNKLTQALFYEKLTDNRVKCLLCPHYCQIKENDCGRCRMRKNIHGELFALNYGNCIGMGLDPMEKKPLYHFLPGTQILSTGPNSCNLSCKFCQNYTSSQMDTSTQFISPHHFLKYCQSEKITSVAFTYTEPLTWYEYLSDLLPLLKSHQIHTVMVSNGTINEEPLKSLLPFVDAWNIDLKSFSEDFYHTICGGNLKTVMRNIEMIVPIAHIEITTLLIPGLNTDETEFIALRDYLADLDREIPWHLSAYYPRYLLNLPATSKEMILHYCQIAKEKLVYVYPGNIADSDHQSDTHCPKCHNLLIRRTGYQSEIRGLKNGLCDRCLSPIRGVFS